MKHTYSYPRVGNLDDITVTDDRGEAIRLITNGYELFTTPQMFGSEHGLFTLVLADQNRAANRVSEEDARRVLSSFETASRELYNSR